MMKHIKIAAVLRAVFLLAGVAVFLQAPHAYAAGSGKAGIKLTWAAPEKVAASEIAGYNVYRAESILGHYEKINGDKPLSKISYSDEGLVKGKRYFYRITTVFTDGKESSPTSPSGCEAGGKPGSPTFSLPQVEFFTSDAIGKVVYLDQEAVFVLKAGAGLTATFSIPGVAEGLAMAETEPGVYRGVYKVVEGLNVKGASATVTLTDDEGGKAVANTPAALNFLGVPKPTLTGFYAGVRESDRTGLNWPGSADQEGYYLIYRDKARILGLLGMKPLSGKISKGTTAYLDRDISPGETYYYVLVSVDGAGYMEYSENLEVKAPRAGRVSGFDYVEENSGGRTLVPGDTLTVTAKTSEGGKAVFALGEAVTESVMEEASPGIYSGVYKIKEGDGVFKTRAAVSFRDKAGDSHFSNSATFVSVNAPRVINKAIAGGMKPVAESITDNIQGVTGVSGRLTAGRTFKVTMKGEPGNKAFFNLGERIWKVPMKESEPGVYEGVYTVRPGDSAGTTPDTLSRTYVAGYLEGPDGILSDPVAGIAPVVVDTSCDIKVELSEGSLPADARSQSRVLITATDADGEPVKNRRLSVMLEPPPGYTGVVGGGGMDTGRTDNSTIGRLDVDFDGLTDDAGRVTATYTSGFAAKTAMIVARDYSTGSVGMGSITTSIATSVSITLTDPSLAGGPVVAPDKPVYQLDVQMEPDPSNPVRVYPGFALNAIPDTLTADGVSRATVIATLTKDGAPAEGVNLIFAVTNAMGSLTAPSDVTDSMGRAQVVFIAGTKAGRALITVTEPGTGITATKVVTLLADAPAKIYVKSYPDTLPADGASTSRVVVEVADINDNPTERVGVSFTLRGENGSISEGGGITDGRGACDFVYTAGAHTGVATIDIYARSASPTDSEIKSAYGRVTAPLVYDNMDYTDLTVIKWYKSPGDPAGRGEPLALVGTPLGDMVVYAPVSGVLDSITIEPGIRVMEGREIGIMK